MANPQIKAVITAEDRASATLRNFGNNASSLGNTLKKGLGVAAIGLAAAGAAAIAFGVSSVKSYQESENALAQLNAVLKSTKGVAGVTAKSAVQLADSLQLVTKFSDEEVLSAENLLLTFTKISKDIFPQATKTVLDMSTALGQDTKASAIQLGKALQDPILGITALRRVGVNFSADQKEVVRNLVETGRSAEAQRLILKELNTEFGGSATAAANTFSGKLAILKNQFDEVKESIGKALVEGLGPLMDKLLAFVKSDKFQQWVTDTSDKIKKMIEETDWEKLAADVATIAKAFIVMGKIIGGTISNIITWQNRFIAIGGRVLFEWQKIINNIKNAWKNLKVSIIATGQGIYANIYRYLINPILKVGFFLQRTIGKFLNMHPAIQKALSGIGNAIIGPFKPAFNWILDMIAKIQGAINGLSAGNIGSVAKTVAGAAAKASKKASGTDFFAPRKYAGGTGSAYGGMALVGERGPELVSMPRGSKVYRNDETKKMMGGVTNINISVPMLTGSANERRKVARMLIKDIQDIAGMNGKSVADMMSSNYGLVT